MIKGRLFIAVLLPCLIFAGAAASEDYTLEQIKTLTPMVSKELRERILREEAETLKRGLAREADFYAKSVSNWQEYDITYYDIAWYPHPDSETLTGCVGIFGKPTVAQLDSVIVNFTDEMPIDSVYNPSGQLTFSRYDDHLLVRLERAYSQGETFGFYVAYEGPPPVDEYGYGILEFRDYNGYPAIDHVSEPFFSHWWWPCNDIPADKADSVDIKITVDTGLTATSNGLLLSDTDNGDGTHTAHWKSRYPIVTYLVCMAVGKYLTWTDYYHYSPTDSMPVPNYVFFDLYDSIKPHYSVAPFVLGVYADLFCEYPFIDEKYGQTMTITRGMEHQTNTFIGCCEPDSNYVLIHEMAHHWWGNLVTCRDWHNAWLNEGFATYTEALYYEYLYGPTIFHQYINHYETFNDHAPYCYDTTDSYHIFAGAYAKGAWALHMMRHIVGDSTFFSILRQYLDTYAYGTAITEDFQETCETVSGMDLDYFFNQWVYEGYLPIYHYSFTTRAAPDGQSWNTYLFIEQVQTDGQEVYIMPVDIVFYFDTDYSITPVWNDRREQSFVFNTSSRADNLNLDPNNWIHDKHYRQPFTIHIISDSLAPAVQGQMYEDTLVIVTAYGAFESEVSSGQFPTGWNLAFSTGIISGLSYDTGSFSFTITAHDAIAPQYTDSKGFTVHLEEAGYDPGDANLDGQVDVGDAVFLINYIFKGGSAPGLANYADANADCLVNVGDVVYLIAFIFNTGPEPQPGCVE